ncbi:MAG: hypothetical protein CMC28_01140 [Flavobacteriaceae bacterium]|nr:hypothetical protein [Flavobacteriaceae bacterium]
MENEYLIYSKLEGDNYLAYVKKNKKFLLISESILDLLNIYLSKSKSKLKKIITDLYTDLDYDQIVNDLEHLLIEDSSTKEKISIPLIPYLDKKFQFKLGKIDYKILYNSSINLNDLIGQLHHLSNNTISESKSIIIFSKNETCYLFIENILIGNWDINKLNFLKGKLISILISNFHNTFETNWSGFLHASVINKLNKSFVIVGSSGSGKTTICKLLIDRGYSLFSDDIAPLDLNGNFAFFPNALSIKETGFDLVSKKISNYKVFDINTFKGVTRYLYPKKQKIENNFIQCNTIIKVKYLKNSKFTLNKNSIHEVLNEFINDSYIPRNDLSVLSFIKWIKGCKVLDITYSDIDDVYDLFERSY